MMEQRKHYMQKEKVAILRRQLLERALSVNWKPFTGRPNEPSSLAAKLFGSLRGISGKNITSEDT